MRGLATTTWGVGDYPLMARELEPVALSAVVAAAVAPGDRVIDVATGTGNAALLAAERGGQVVGVDLEPALLELAVQRARDAALDIPWLRGEMQALPFQDGSADVVLSVFGVMYAADHAAAAAELARVAAPGARVVLAAWVPGSVLPGMGHLLAGYLPTPPASSAPPSRWGDPGELRVLLEGVGLQVTDTSSRGLVLTFPSAPAAAEFLVQTAGHVVSERQRLTASDRWDDLRQDMVSFVNERAEVVGDQLHLTLQYLLCTARRASAPAAGAAAPSTTKSG